MPVAMPCQAAIPPMAGRTIRDQVDRARTGAIAQWWRNFQRLADVELATGSRTGIGAPLRRIRSRILPIYYRKSISAARRSA